MELQGCNRQCQRCFPLFDLPVGILCNIFSRLLLKNIVHCKLVCKKLLKLLEDPYFVEIHFATASISEMCLVLHERRVTWESFRFFTFDLGEVSLSSCSSTEDDFFCSCYLRTFPELQNSLSTMWFDPKTLSVVGSCNGLLCYMSKPSKPSFYVCNPVLSEYVSLPRIEADPPVYTYANHSGFGYSARTKQYKVISFMRVSPPASSNDKMMLAEVHTLGSDSWRKIYKNVPCPKKNSFDPLLNSALHWITNSREPTELISSFDLDNEKFRFVPPPAHFTRHYMRKVSWINIGVLRGCLCVCHIYEDNEFEVWVMREYGVKESWRKEFGIDLKYYCKLLVDDLRRPIKFQSNGDLWLISSSKYIVSFSPTKRTFRELKYVGDWKTSVYAHDLSLRSLKNVMEAKPLAVKKVSCPD